MALRVLILRSKLDAKNKVLTSKRTELDGFEAQERELEEAIGEMNPDTPDEEREAVSAKVEELEEKKKNLQTEVDELEAEIAEIEEEIAAEEEAEPEPEPEPGERNRGVKGEKRTMDNRRRFFGMNIQERDEFFTRNDVKQFLEKVREAAAEKRSVNGANLLIPTVVLDILKEKIDSYSKLAKYINLKPVKGKARQNVQGTIPEAIWTEACAALNEMDLAYTNVEVDGYKVGGFIPICNSTLEDADDVNLATEIITALGQAIGYALDKAMIYGTGTKMPMGVFTRLAQTSEPSDYPATFRTWVDLHTSNIKTIASGKTGIALYKEIITNSANAKSKYSKGDKFWAMNEVTKTALLAEALSINAAGAIVSGQNDTMPVIGGQIETLDFIPDNNIIGGYGDLYLMAEREGTNIAQSEHVRFLEDQTVFKGTARYDGIPVIAEGFVAIGINGTIPSASSVTFADDNANDARLDSLSVGSEALSPTFDADEDTYEITASGASGQIQAVPVNDDAQVTAKYDGKKALIGGTITFATGTKNLIVTVKAGNETKRYTVAITKE